MIIGAHAIIYSTQPAADREFLRDVIGMPSVDVGEGWLIFGLPPAEVAVHPSGKNDLHELYLMCDDVQTLVAGMEKRGIACGPVRDQGWGILTQVTLPGGGKLGIYQPRHARPEPMAVGTAKTKPASRPTAKPRKKAAKAAQPTKSKPAKKPAKGSKPAKKAGTKAPKRRAGR